MDDAAVEPVQVFVRIRPEPLCDPSDTKRTVAIDKCLHIIDDKTLRFSPPDAIYGMRKGVPAVDDKIYSFDGVFGENATQDLIYERVKNNVRATVNGYNTTIFAYGSTGSGKSYTMTGTTAQPGIIPRAISEVFAYIETAASQERDVFFYVRLSYVELYNNNFRNLLEFASKELTLRDNKANDEAIHHDSTFGMGMKGKSKIEVRESQSAGVFLAGPNLRIPVTTAPEAFALISRGNKSRAVGATQCNDVSSRSHAVLTVHVESRVSCAGAGGASELRLGKMHLVDLAGSERVSMSGAEGDTLTETQNINLSLSAIGDVLSALSRNATVQQQQSVSLSTKASPLKGQSWAAASSLVPVPYRNSKLTHLLKDSLGGNSKTIMVTTVRSTAEYAQLTSASLMYSSRAKKIRNRSLINHDVIGDTGIAKVTSEIERLRARLDERTQEFGRLRALHLEENQENAALKNRLQELQLANEFEKRELETQMSQVIHSQAGELAMHKERIVSLQSALEGELSVSLNRIAEQEQEIRWLQRALDETSTAAPPSEDTARLRAELEEWRKQAIATQSDLQLALLRNEELRTANSGLHRRVSVSEEQAQELGQVKEHMSASLSQTEEELGYFRFNKEALEVKVAALEDKLREMVQESLQKELSLKEAMQSVEAIKSTASFIEASKDELLEALRSAKSKEDAAVKESTRLKQLLEQSVGALERETQAMVQAAAKKSAAAESTKGRLESDLNAASSDNAKLRVELDVCRRQRSEDASKAEAECTSLRNDAASLKSMANELRTQLADQRNANGDLKARLGAFKTEVATRNAELIAKSGAYASDLEKRVHEVQALQREHGEELLSERERHRIDIEARSQSFAREVGQLQSEVEEALRKERDVNKSLAAEVELLRKELILKSEAPTPEATSNSSSEEEHARLREHYEAQVSRARAEAEAAVEEALSAQRIKYKLLMKEKLSEVQKAHEEALSDKLTEARRTHKGEVARLLQESQQVVDAKSAEVQQLSAAYRSEVQSLREENDKTQAELLSAFNSSNADWSERLEGVKTDALKKERRLSLLLVRAKDADELQDIDASVSVEGKEEGSVLAPEDPVAALRELQLEHTRRVQGLRATIASNGLALNELQLKLSDETKARVSVEEELKDLRTSLEQSEVVVRQLKERVDVQKEQFEQELASQAQGYENRLVGMERDSAQVLREECADMEAELSDNKARVRELEAETIALQSQLESKAAERAANEDKVLQMLKDKERYYRKAADEALEESEEQYRLELEAVQAKHSAAMAEAERRLAEATSSMTSAQAEMDAQAKQERYLKFEALREEAKHAVAMAEERMRDEHNSILSRLISRHAFETEALHTELQDSRQALTGAAQEYETMAAYLADLEGAFESRLAEELGALREEATELRAVQLEQAVVVAELEKTIDRLVGENRDAEGQREAALEQHSRAQDRMQQSLRSLAAEMTALQESNAAYASSLRAMERELDEERAAARAVKLRLEASLHKAQADSEAYVRDVLRTNEEELRTMVQEKIGGFSRISELEGRLETLTTELSAKAEAELARVREQHASELQAAEARRREAMSRLEAEADAREEELQSAHRRAVRDMRQACDADMAAAEEWAEKRAQQRMAELTARMREAEELSRAKVLELESLTAEFEASRTALKRIAEESKLEEALASEQQQQTELDVRARRQLADELHELKTQHREECAALESQWRSALSTQMKAAEESHSHETEALQLQLDVLAAERDAALVQATEWRARAAELEGDVVAETEAREKLAVQATSAAKELEERYEAELLRLGADLASQREESRLAEQERERAVSQLDALVKASTRERDDAILRQQQRESEHTAELGRLTDAYEERFASHKSELLLARGEIASQKEAFEARHVAEVDALRGDVERLTRDQEELRQQREELARTHSEQLREAADRVALTEASAREQAEVWRSDREAALESHRRALQAAVEEGQHRLLDCERDHITRLEAVHEQLRQVEARHFARVERLESILLESVAAKDELYAIVQAREAVIRELGGKIEGIEEEALRALLERDAHNQDRLRADLDAEKRKIDAQYRGEITHLVERNAGLQRSLEAALSRARALEQQVSVQHSELMGVTVEKRVLEDVYANIIDSSRQQPASSSSAVVTSLRSGLAAIVKESLSNRGGEHSRKQPYGVPSVQSSSVSSFSSDQGTADVAVSPKLRGAGEDRGTSNVNVRRAALPRPPDDVQLRRHGSTPKATGPLVDLDSSDASPSQRSQRSSPADLFVSAILEGDTQRLVAAVRSKGTTTDLRSGYWKDLEPSLLPLHRALSGLHFHGSERLLVSVLTVLLQLGADVNCVDQAGGGSVLHRIVQVCTSKSVCSVLELLLVQGADPNVCSKDGESPLHLECKRSRSASADVIKLLTDSGARPDLRIRGAAYPSTGATALTVLLANCSVLPDNSSNMTAASVSASVGGGRNRKPWVRALQQLLRGGARWEPSALLPNGHSQLTLLLTFFPPSPADTDAYTQLVTDAVDAGFDLLREDGGGRTPLFTLCERMAETPLSECPDVTRLFSAVIALHGRRGLGAADRNGMSMLDIPSRVERSCLALCRDLLSDAILSKAALKS